VFTFLLPLPSLWYLLAIKLAAVVILRGMIHFQREGEK